MFVGASVGGWVIRVGVGWVDVGFSFRCGWIGGCVVYVMGCLSCWPVGVSDRPVWPTDRSPTQPKPHARMDAGQVLLACGFLTAGERHDLAVHKAHTVEDVAPVGVVGV